MIRKFSQRAFGNIRTGLGDFPHAAKIVARQYDPLAPGASQLQEQLGSRFWSAAPHENPPAVRQSDCRLAAR